MRARLGAIFEPGAGQRPALGSSCTQGRLAGKGAWGSYVGEAPTNRPIARVTGPLLMGRASPEAWAAVE